jgi:NADP-dependent isocitrate dehydrogenase
VKHPEKVNMVVFRENTEDVYAGIEWPAGSAEAERLAAFLKEQFGVTLPDQAAIGIKPMSRMRTQRLVRRAVRHALERGLASVTLVHKGNIMKFTEGAFREWGYELAATEFAAQTLTEADLWEKHAGKTPSGRVIIKDRIADAMFQQVLLRPDEYQVLATPISTETWLLSRQVRPGMAQGQIRQPVRHVRPRSTAPSMPLGQPGLISGHAAGTPGLDKAAECCRVERPSRMRWSL